MKHELQVFFSVHSALLDIHISSLVHWEFIGTTECNRAVADGEAKEYH